MNAQILADGDTCEERQQWMVHRKISLKKEQDEKWKWNYNSSDIIFVRKAIIVVIIILDCWMVIPVGVRIPKQ